MEVLAFLQLLMALWQRYTRAKRMRLQLLQVLLRRRTRRERQRRLRRQVILRLITTRRSHAVWAHPRSRYWWDSIVPDFSAQQFVQNFRVSRESFNYICDQARDLLVKDNTNYRKCVPVQKRVAIAIWKLATGSEYRTISHLFGVGIATVFNCLRDFCDFVNTVLLPVHIKTPDAAKLLEMATFFENRWRVPQCVGAIDGSHLPIIAPQEYPRDYYNRKGWHSIILQAVVDGKGQIWDVCVGYPGSVHDARVLRQSELWTIVNDGQLLGQNKKKISDVDVGYYLIGDPAYPMQSWLMKPFSDTGRLTPEQRTYNYRLSSARSVVEMAFGRLKGRWRCLLKRNDCRLELSKKMAMTCCVLHNICEEHGDNYTDERASGYENNQPLVHALTDTGNTEGADIRAALIEYFNQAD